MHQEATTHKITISDKTRTNTQKRTIDTETENHFENVALPGKREGTAGQLYIALGPQLKSGNPMFRRQRNIPEGDTLATKGKPDYKNVSRRISNA